MLSSEELTPHTRMFFVLLHDIEKQRHCTTKGGQGEKNLVNKVKFFIK